MKKNITNNISKNIVDNILDYAEDAICSMLEKYSYSVRCNRTIKNMNKKEIQSMKKNITNNISKNIADNILNYAEDALCSMLEEYSVRWNRTLQFEVMEDPQEVFMTFPEIGALKLEPVGDGIRFMENKFYLDYDFSGNYAQLMVDRFLYKDLKNGEILEPVYRDPRQMSEELGIDEETAREWIDAAWENAPYIYPTVVCFSPDNDSSLELISRVVNEGTCQGSWGAEGPGPAFKVYGEGSFKIPLCVSIVPKEDGNHCIENIYFTYSDEKRRGGYLKKDGEILCSRRLEDVLPAVSVSNDIEEDIDEDTEESPHRKVRFRKLQVAIPKVSLPRRYNLITGEPDITYNDRRNLTDPADILTIKNDDGDDAFPELLHGTMLNSIEKMKEKLKPFHLTDMDKKEDEEEDITTRFLTYHFRTHTESGKLKAAIDKSRYNLLINAEDTEHAMDLVYTLIGCVYPEICRDDIVKIDETELACGGIGEQAGKIMDAFKKKVVVIKNCVEKPVFNIDKLGGGGSHDAKNREIEIYNKRWLVINEMAKESDAAILIIIANNIVTTRSFRNDREVYERVCRNHLKLHDLTVDQLYDRCMDKLRDMTFQFSEDFEENFRTYLENELPGSGLLGTSFVNEQVSRICSNYYSSGAHKPGRLISRYIPVNMLPPAEEILAELDRLIGLENVKKELRTMYNRCAALGRADKEIYHMCFYGNPGTGKTTVAGLLKYLFYHMGIIKEYKMVILKAGDFRSHWRGATNEKVHNMIKEAYGGILFIDEAYGLGDEDFQQGLEILMQEMEDQDNPNRPLVIFAGYEEEIRKKLFEANPGLESRINMQIKFEDYSLEELYEILLKMLSEKGFGIEPGAEEAIKELIEGRMFREHFGNARDMRTLSDELGGAWADVYVEEKKDSNKTDSSVSKHQMADKRMIEKKHAQRLKPSCKKESIEEQIGLKKLKEQIRTFKNSVVFTKDLKERALKENEEVNHPVSNMHMAFMGNPGTGKTTMAKLLADDLYRCGVLKTNKCIVVEKKDLVLNSGQKRPTQITADYIRKAKGGILFIDEAYSLADNDGREVIEVLLTAMEENKENTIFVFAGYTDQMQIFLDSNPGLRSRIGYKFYFDDYTPEELVQIFEKKMTEAGFKMEEDMREDLKDHIESFCDMPGFGNGRFVEELLVKMIGRHAVRMDDDSAEKNSGEYSLEELRTFTKADIPEGDKPKMSEKRMEEEKVRTVIHELGHAVVSMATDDEHNPGISLISVKDRYGSLGRIEYLPRDRRNEKELKDWIAMLLSGRNAEKLIFNDSSCGCKSDYQKAKDLAGKMVNEYAMGELGVTTDMDILKEADKQSKNVLKENEDFIRNMVDILKEKREMSGEEVTNMYLEYCKNKKS